MGDGVVRVVVFVIFVVAHHYWGVIAKAVAAHEGEIVLKRAPAHRVAAPLIFGKSIGAGIDEIGDGPAAEAVTKAAVYGGNSDKGGSVEWHGMIFFANLTNFVELRKSIAQRDGNFAGKNR